MLQPVNSLVQQGQTDDGEDGGYQARVVFLHPGFDSVQRCVKAVAGVLGNTPAVCRAAYIHPAILAAYESGDLDLKGSSDSRAFELAVLRWLEKARDAAAHKAA